jgi:hypothetical protein
MSYGPYVVFPISVASGATRTSEVNLGRSWKQLYLDVPTFPSQTTLYLVAAAFSGGPYRRLYGIGSYTATVQGTEFSIQSTCSNAILKLESFKNDTAFSTGNISLPFKYIQIETQTSIDDGVSFNLICSD